MIAAVVLSLQAARRLPSAQLSAVVLAEIFQYGALTRTFAVSDDFTIADAAIAPFLARLKVALKNDIGAYKEDEGKKTWEVYHSDRFAKLRK